MDGGRIYIRGSNYDFTVAELHLDLVAAPEIKFPKELCRDLDAACAIQDHELVLGRFDFIQPGNVREHIGIALFDDELA